MRRRMYTLDYPNDEVRRGFVSLMANSYFHTKEVDNENWIIQIEEQQYALPYQNGKRKVHKIGVNISSASRTVDEWVVVD